MFNFWPIFFKFCESYLGISGYIFKQILLTFFLLFIYFILKFVLCYIIRARISDDTTSYFATKTTKYILWFILIIAFLRTWFGSVSGIAAYLGLLSAGIAVALQDPLINLVGWIFINLRRPFTVGHRIQIGEHIGDVIDQHLLQFTILEVGNWVHADQSSGRIIHIPNGWTFKHSICNYSEGFNFIWDEIAVTVTFESNWQKAKKILTTLANEIATVTSEQAKSEIKKITNKYMVFFKHLTPIVWTSVADHGVTLTVRYPCRPRKRRISEALFWEKILIEFAQYNDIDFAYPTTRLYNNRTEGKNSNQIGD